MTLFHYYVMTRNVGYDLFYNIFDLIKQFSINWTFSFKRPIQPILQMSSALNEIKKHYGHCFRSKIRSFHSSDIWSRYSRFTWRISDFSFSHLKFQDVWTKFVSSVKISNCKHASYVISLQSTVDDYIFIINSWNKTFETFDFLSFFTNSCYSLNLDWSAIWW